MTVIQKIAFIIEPKPQRADTKTVMHAQQVIRFIKTLACRGHTCPFFTFQPSFHQQPSPAIRTGIRKGTKNILPLCRILGASE